MPKIDISSVPERKGASYPAPFHVECAERVRKRLGDAGGLTQFGVNLLRLPPGVWSSLRHWHSAEDEFVCVLSGEVVLVTGEGEETLRPGDCAAFPKGVADGHKLVNKSKAMATVLEVGGRAPEDVCTYSDVDMVASMKGYTRKDGTLYPLREDQK
jgi:uncharacterized cupin superfamily protein